MQVIRQRIFAKSKKTAPAAKTLAYSGEVHLDHNSKLNPAEAMVTGMRAALTTVS